MKDVTIEEFCAKYKACADGVQWAKINCPSGMMSEAYERLSNPSSDEERDYFEWVYSRAWDDKTLRLLAVRFVRETPLADGRKVFDLLTDERSINALVVAEKYALDLASKEDLTAARDAAWAAALDAALDAAGDAARATNEIQGAAVMRANGTPFYFLPMFGFANPEAIPA